jgi:uncharacterized damage-inducible protein DinB
MNIRSIKLFGCCAILCAATVISANALAQEAGGMPETSVSAQMGKPIAPAKVYGDLYKIVEGEIISAAEAMPADKYDFAPPATAGDFKGVRTFGGQVQHLIGANYGFFSAYGAKPPMTRAQVMALKTKEQLVQGLKDSFDWVNQQVATITPENAFVTVSKEDEIATRAGAATFCLAHANDHYGQMVEYLRMNGIIPPASQKK